MWVRAKSRINKRLRAATNILTLKDHAPDRVRDMRDTVSPATDSPCRMGARYMFGIRHGFSTPDNTSAMSRFFTGGAPAPVEFKRSTPTEAEGLFAAERKRPLPNVRAQL